jgi:hypothetical protein
MILDSSGAGQGQVAGSCEHYVRHNSTVPKTGTVKILHSIVRRERYNVMLQRFRLAERPDAMLLFSDHGSNSVFACQ